jgi:hypothetical protein
VAGLVLGDRGLVCGSELGQESIGVVTPVRLLGVPPSVDTLL